MNIQFNIKNTILVAVLLFINFVNAQEIIKEPEVKKDSVKPFKRQKIDGIIATVGDYSVLDSDIDKAFLEISSQGNSVKDITRCQMVSTLLKDKLFAHQAIQDSVIVKIGRAHV